MKKYIISAVFLVMMLFALSASAESVSVNGRDVAFSTETGIPYVNSDYRTMVPVRVISENLGADVAWDEAEQKVTVTTTEHKVELFAGSSDMIVDGVKKQMDTQVVEKGGRTYLPVRYIAESIGCYVFWFDYKEKAVILDGEHYDKYVTFRDMFSYNATLSDYTEVVIITATSEGIMTLENMKAFWAGLSVDEQNTFVTLATMEKHEKNPQYPISVAYIFKDETGAQYYLATASTFSYDVQLFNVFE